LNSCLCCCIKCWRCYWHWRWYWCRDGHMGRMRPAVWLRTICLLMPSAFRACHVTSCACVVDTTVLTDPLLTSGR
jgi:hypothetical protein